MKKIYLIGGAVGLVGIFYFARKTAPTQVESVPGPSMFIPSGAPGGGAGDVTTTGQASSVDSLTAALMAMNMGAGGSDTPSADTQIQLAALANQKDIALSGDKLASGGFGVATDKTIKNWMTVPGARLNNFNLDIAYDDAGRIVSVDKQNIWTPKEQTRFAIFNERADTIKKQEDLKQAKLDRKIDKINNPEKYAKVGKAHLAPKASPKPKPKAKSAGSILKPVGAK